MQGATRTGPRSETGAADKQKQAFSRHRTGERYATNTQLCLTGLVEHRRLLQALAIFEFSCYY